MYRTYSENQKSQMTVLKTPFVKDGLSVGDTYKIETIRVQQGHEFEIKLYDVGWIKGYLQNKTPALAQKPVIELLNQSKNPRVVLVEQLDNAWKVEIIVELDGKDVKLLDWLTEQGLIFN